MAIPGTPGLNCLAQLRHLVLIHLAARLGRDEEMAGPTSPVAASAATADAFLDAAASSPVPILAAPSSPTCSRSVLGSPLQRPIRVKR